MVSHLTQVEIETFLIHYQRNHLTGIGSAVARLELSTLPEHIGTNMILTRILKILQPVECVHPGYDGYRIQPEEGSYLSTLGHDGVRRPCAIDLGKKNVTSAGFKVFLPRGHGQQK